MRELIAETLSKPLLTERKLEDVSQQPWLVGIDGFCVQVTKLHLPFDRCLFFIELFPHLLPVTTACYDLDIPAGGFPCVSKHLLCSVHWSGSMRALVPKTL